MNYIKEYREKVFPRADRAAPRVFTPGTEPLDILGFLLLPTTHVISSEQPCQPVKNLVHPSSFLKNISSYSMKRTFDNAAEYKMLTVEAKT